MLTYRQKLHKKIKKNPETIASLFGNRHIQTRTKKALVITNSLNFDIEKGFLNITFTAVKLIVKHIIFKLNK